MRGRGTTVLRRASGLALALFLAAGPGTADPVVGEWSDVLDWPLVAIHMMQLPNGEILVVSNQLSFGGLVPEDPHLWDPTGGCFEESGGCFTPKPNPVDIFCGGHTHLDDGTVIVNGGHRGNHLGEEETWLFEHDREADDWDWVEVESTDFARWYPTLTTLPDGRVLNVSGSQKRCSSGGDVGELCTVHADCAPEETENCEAVLVAEPEIYDPADRTWSTLTAITESVEFYPFNFVDPDGDVFFAGADAGAESWDIAPTDSRDFLIDEEDLSGNLATSATAGGSAVMYAPGRILKSGGWTSWPDAIADAEIIDLNGAAAWAPTGSMNVPRRRHNLTVLPDGTVLATGGTRRDNQEFDRFCGGTSDGDPCESSDDCEEGTSCREDPESDQHWVAEAELWDPSTGVWTVMASSQVPRMYHSTALLLPDGRVVSAGGGRGGGAANHYANAELYSPPYLFVDGERPTITDAPEIIHYGRSFEVRSPQAADVDRVSLVRLAAVTHSFDQDRRFVPLTFGPVGDFGLAIDAPVSPNDAPPGYYMLFLLSDEGYPSVARFVRLMPADPGAGASHEYAAKIVCGVQTADDLPRREPGHYSTSVNIHNPGPARTRFYKKLALTYPPGDQVEGEILPIGHHALDYDEALQSDCADLRRRVVPSHDAPFVEGFLVIQSRGPLDVTAVYSTSEVGPNGGPAGHSSVDVERVPARRPESDLSVGKTVFLFPEVRLTDNITFYLALYSVQVTNSGPGVAGSVVLADELALDAADTFGAAVIVTDPIILPPGAVVTGTAQPSFNLSTMTVDLGDLASGETVAVHFLALAMTSVLGDDPHARLRDTASVTSSSVETAPANNTATVETVLIP